MLFSRTAPARIGRWFSSTRHNPSPISIRPLVDVRSCRDLELSHPPEYIPLPHSQLHTLYYNRPVRNVFITKKPWDSRVRSILIDYIKHIHTEHPSLNIMVDPACADEVAAEFTATAPGIIQPYRLYTSETMADITARTDLMVTLGGDGTVLRAVSLFSNQVVPPILPLSMGTLGFLLPFNVDQFAAAFKTVIESRARVMHRSRLECHIWRRPVLDPFTVESATEASGTDQALTASVALELPIDAEVVHAMNDIVLHRGAFPHLTTFDIYINNEFVTRTTGDGVTFSTPTGSTAYSLSCGGGIVHPLVECILLTPICPRSLSFRPLILPATAHIMLKVADTNRNSTIGLSIDGVSHKDLRVGDELHIVLERSVSTAYACTEEVCPPSLMQRNLELQNEVSALPPVSSGPSGGIWCVANGDNDWTTGINHLLGFNSSFKASPR